MIPSVMEGLFILLLLFLLWLLIAPIIALIKASNSAKDASEARELLRILNQRIAKLQSEIRALQAAEIVPPAVTRKDEPETEEEAPSVPVWERAPLPLTPRTVEAPVAPPVVEWAEVSPPPIPPSHPPPAREEPPAAARAAEKKDAEEAGEPFSLERFMGTKLFAWLGGVAMFFGVIFFVKYAFEHNLIPPSVRVTMGFITGAGLLGGGLVLHKLPKYHVLAQAFCATGVLILYGVSYAAHAIYQFPVFNQITTFVIMGSVTAAAFLIAVRLNALVVAVLGMLGGFLTPVLLSTGNDQVFRLFAYIAVLDIGLLAVSRHSNWRYLSSAAAVGTALIQAGWFGKYFLSGHYDEGARTLIPMAIAVVFILMFLGSAWLSFRKRDLESHAAGSVMGLAAVAMVFAFILLGFPQVADRHFTLYGFVLILNLAVIAIVALRPSFGACQVAVAIATFLHLAGWSLDRLSDENLPGALALYLVFGAIHAVAPVWLSRRFPDQVAPIPLKAARWASPLMLVLMMLPVLGVSPVPMTLWVAVMLANLLVIALAVATGAIFPVLASLLLTMGVATLWLFEGPASDFPLMPFLGVITGFSALFSAAGHFLARHAEPDDLPGKSPDELAVSALPIGSGVLPFGMLILALGHLQVLNPYPVFLVALLMSALLCGLALTGKRGGLVLAAMLCTLGVEAFWHIQHVDSKAPMLALPWYLAFYALFLGFPFVFRKTCAEQAAPWIAGALSGVGHFLLIHDLVGPAYQIHHMGLIPAAFAVPSLVALWAVARRIPASETAMHERIAWFGGVSLFFITLIFPIELDRQWLTISWALEGAALLWLFRRVPHPGLQLTGLMLLGVAFVRLALNPAAFIEYGRSGTPILNWHLYTYGVVAAAMFAGGYWLTQPVGRLKDANPRGMLFAFGTILLFLLLNLEIADFFTEPGEGRITFRFGGNFARDMTYSIAWGLFSLGMLGMGIWKKSKHARFASIGLLVAALLKVFLHDLAAIENIFRIGALIGVAIIAFVASFLYQRFFDRSEP